MKLHCKCDRFFTPCGACPTQAKSKDREYLFTFDVRAGKDENGATIWNREQLKAFGLFESLTGREWTNDKQARS